MLSLVIPWKHQTNSEFNLPTSAVRVVVNKYLHNPTDFFDKLKKYRMPPASSTEMRKKQSCNLEL